MNRVEPSARLGEASEWIQQITGEQVNAEDFQNNLSDGHTLCK